MEEREKKEVYPTRDEEGREKRKCDQEERRQHQKIPTI